MWSRDPHVTERRYAAQMSAAVVSKSEKLALKARKTAAKDWLRELKSKEVDAIKAALAKSGSDHWFLRDAGGLGALLKHLKHKAPEVRARRWHT